MFYRLLNKARARASNERIGELIMKLKDLKINIAGNPEMIELVFAALKTALVVMFVSMIFVTFFNTVARASNDCITGHVDRIKDGDTYVITVPEWPELFRTSSFRLRDVDTPELRSKCDTDLERFRERGHGRRAKLLVSKLMIGKEVLACDLGIDNFGRILAKISVINVVHVDVADFLLSNKAAKPYVKGARPWCGK